MCKTITGLLDSQIAAYTIKPVQSGHLKTRQLQSLEGGHLMQNQSIADSSNIDPDQQPHF